MSPLKLSLAAALALLVAGCAGNQGGQTTAATGQNGATQRAADGALPDGLYAIRFETSGCGELKLGGEEFFKWDKGCDGGPPDYERRILKRVGTRVYIEAATLKATSVSATGFTGTWSFRGTKERATATRR